MKNELEIFHVHTYRCKHASGENDEQYIKKAIELNASKITFTDHALFPNNPFGNRMAIEELPEYVNTLKLLKEKYAAVINVQIGLEIEYLPSYNNYYKWLKESKWFDILMIGQHFYECSDGKYSFQLDNKTPLIHEYKGLGKALLDGIDTGYFDAIAHPDRMFRECREWTPEMEKISAMVIKRAIDKNIMLEQNLSSMEKKYQYWIQLWNMATEEVSIVKGIDAHSVLDLEKILINGIK